MRRWIVVGLLICSLFVVPPSTAQTGDDVTVGVIDWQFDQTDPAIQDNFEGEAQTFGDTQEFPFSTDNAHGTAVAEIVTRQAPDVELALAVLPVPGETGGQDLQDATTWLIEEADADVIVASIGVYGEPYDGTGDAAAAASIAADAGVPFVASAGNAADSHWAGDPDDLSGRTISDGTVFFSLKNWSNTSQNPQTLEITEAGTTDTLTIEPGTQRAANVSFVPSEATISASGDREVQVFVVGGSVSSPVSSGTILAPATSPDSIAVGAVGPQEQLRDFSSRGPTVDARPGIDVVAHDGISLDSQDKIFRGTSASAPVVAGALASAIEYDPGINLSRARQILQTAAPGDQRDPGRGYGVVNETAILSVGEVIVRDLSLVNNGVNISVENPDPLRAIESRAVSVNGDTSSVGFNVSADSTKTQVVSDLGTWGNVSISIGNQTVRGYVDQENVTSENAVYQIDGPTPGIHGFEETVVDAQVVNSTGSWELDISGLQPFRTYVVYEGETRWDTQTTGRNGTIQISGDDPTSIEIVATARPGQEPSQAISWVLILGAIVSVVAAMGIIYRRRRVRWY